jgi:hypothetical protein
MQRQRFVISISYRAAEKRTAECSHCGNEWLGDRGVHKCAIYECVVGGKAQGFGMLVVQSLSTARAHRMRQRHYSESTVSSSRVSQRE